MKVLLTQALPDNINRSFNSNYPVGTVFEVIPDEKKQWELQVAKKPTRTYPIWPDEQGCFKVIEDDSNAD